MSEAAVTSEPWPDPDDVADWLAALEAGIGLLDEQRAGAVTYLEMCRDAVETARATPSAEASQRVCLLIHGVIIEPGEIDPEEVELVAAHWTPPTDQERRTAQLAENKRNREQQLAEEKRRIAHAEQHFPDDPDWLAERERRLAAPGQP